MSKTNKPLSEAGEPLNEAERLAALKSYNILDTIPEVVLDEITQAASEFCGTKIALISLVDESRQWFKSAVGLAVSETPRDVSFCAHAILQADELLEIEDTALDPRFANNPLVTDDPNIRFYAGMPLTTSDGHSLGTLCVLDHQPHKLTDSQRQGLKHLSNAVTALFDERLGKTLSPLGHAIEETLTNGILITDANQPDNPIMYCNRGFEKLSGYNREEIIGKNCRFLQGNETDPADVEKLRNAVANNEECKLTLKNYRKDGTPFWNELSVSPIRNIEGHVTHFFGIQQDVTAQHNAEERELGFSTVLEDSLNEIYIFDAETLGFIQVNEGARRNLGYSMAELKAMTPLDIKLDHTLESFAQAISPLTTGEEQKIEFNTVHQRKNGSTYLVEVHLQKMQFNDRPVFVAITLDITERTQTNLELLRANTFLDSAPDATVVVDESGKIQVCNRQMVNLLGYSHEELKGMSVDELVPDRYRDGHAAHRADYAAKPRVRGMGSEMDLSAMTKDGREIPIEVSLSPIKTPDGNLVAAAIRDISARKATENALRESEEELRLAKVAAEDATAGKSRFLAAASHDLRQPLQALRLYLSALSRNLDQPKQLSLSNKMNLSLDTMGALLDALLDISTLESGSIQAQKRDVSLLEVLDHIVADNSQQAAEKGLQFDCNGPDCVIHTDPVLLERIIENFITNAIRYTEKGNISIQCQLCDDVVRIAVSDTGVGIPEDAMERIFDEFHQLDNAVRDRTKGLGLGLSIVKHIARILDHPTTIESFIGEGSTFSVEVPLGESIVVADETIYVIHPPSSKVQEPTILIVDDDASIVDAMQELMTAFDVTVVTAHSGAEAMSYIQDGLKPDLVVSDYRMPEMNGVELVIKIRAVIGEDVPVVIMTGDTSAAKIKEANLDNCSVLYKPINMEQLVALVDSVIA